jgi:nucleoid-associated protein YgaU
VTILPQDKDQARLTVRAIDEGKPGFPDAPLPTVPSWSASDGTVLRLLEVPEHPEQVIVQGVGPGTATVLVSSGDLTATVEFEVPEIVEVPVATKLIVDVVLEPRS